MEVPVPMHPEGREGPEAIILDLIVQDTVLGNSSTPWFTNRSFFSSILFKYYTLCLMWFMYRICDPFMSIKFAFYQTHPDILSFQSCIEAGNAFICCLFRFSIGKLFDNGFLV